MPDMTIYPAHTYTRDWQMREKGTQTYRQYRHLAERVGDAKAFATLGNAHPFVAANYSSGAIVIGVSANTGTGLVQTTSKGVDFTQSGAEWSAFLKGKGPLPADAPKAQSNVAPNPILASLLKLSPAAAVEMTLAHLTCLYDGSAARLAKLRDTVKAFRKYDAEVSGDWVSKSTANALILEKTGADATLRLIVDAGTGISMRAEVGFGGLALAVQPPRADGWMNTSRADLVVEDSPRPEKRFIPANKQEWQAVARPPSFLI